MIIMPVNFPVHRLAPSVLSKYWSSPCPSFPFILPIWQVYPHLDLLEEMRNILIWLISRGQHPIFVFHELLQLFRKMFKHLCLGQELLQGALLLLLLQTELLETLAHLCQFALQHCRCGAVCCLHELRHHFTGGLQAALLPSNVLLQFLSPRACLLAPGSLILRYLSHTLINP